MRQKVLPIVPKQDVTDKARQRAKQGMTSKDIVILDHPVTVIPERTAQGNIRVSKPGANSV